jgi:putative inorganic carbon (HCO3(-)) transporter
MGVPMSTVGRITRAAAAAELAILVVIAPAFLFPSASRLLVALAMPLAWFANWKIGRRVIPPTPLNVSLFVLLVMVGVSLYATFDIRVSLGKVSGVVFGVLIFWAVTRRVGTQRDLAVATLVFVLAGAGLATVGLLGANWIDKFPLFAGVIDRLPKAIRGVPGAEEGFQPNAVAGCLVMFVPLQVALITVRATQWPEAVAWAGRQGWIRPAQGLLLALTAGTLLLTQSRGAWTGMLVAVGAFCLWFSRTTRVLATIAVAGVVSIAIAMGPERLVNVTISQSGPGMTSNVSGRLELWSRAIDAIRDFPLTGMGMNTFRHVMPLLYPAFLASPDLDVAHAHNHLLQAALDLGLPGLVAYLSIWMTTAVLLVAVYRRAGTRFYRTMAGGLGAGLIAHFTFSTTDAIALGAKVGVLFWLTLALAVALHRVSVGPSARSSASAPSWTALR